MTSHARNMTAARKMQDARRKTMREGPWIVASFAASTQGWIVIDAVKRQPTYNIDPGDLTTRQSSQFARWATRQACHQWLKRHTVPAGFLPLNLSELFGIK